MKRQILLLNRPRVIVRRCRQPGQCAPCPNQTGPRHLAGRHQGRTEVDAIIARLETAVTSRDKFGAEDALAELEGLIPSDSRMPAARQGGRVAGTEEKPDG